MEVKEEVLEYSAGKGPGTSEAASRHKQRGQWVLTFLSVFFMPGTHLGTW